MDATEEAMAAMDQEVIDRWNEERQEDIERHSD